MSQKGKILLSSSRKKENACQKKLYLCANTTPNSYDITKNVASNKITYKKSDKEAYY